MKQVFNQASSKHPVRIESNRCSSVIKGRSLRALQGIFSIVLFFPALLAAQAPTERTVLHDYYQIPGALFGLTKEVDGPRNDVSDRTQYRYTPLGYLYQIENAQGHIVEFTDHDGAGRPLEMQDANGVLIGFSYTPRGWIDKVTLDKGGLNAVTVYDYDDVGKMTSIVSPEGVRKNYDYDGASRLIGISDEAGNEIKYALDSLGNTDIEEVYDTNSALKRIVDYEYDALGRLRVTLGETTGSGQFQSTRDYDLNNNLNQTQVGGPTGKNPVQRFYDALNQLNKVKHADTLPNGSAYTSEYGYDSQGHLTSFTDQRGLVTTYKYSGLGYLEEIDSPDTGLTTYTYDAAGNRLSKTDARKVVTNYRYDKLNRLTAIEYPASPSDNISYRYDEIAGGNHGIGRLTRVEDPSGVTLFFYNALGHLILRSHLIEGVSYIWRFGYDLEGNIISIRYPSGRTVNFSRDYQSHAQVTGISTTAWDGLQTEQILVSQVKYLPFGPLTEFTYGNSVVHTLDYDLDFRVDGVRSVLNSTSLQARTLSYFNTNNMKNILDTLDANNDQAFTYDQENRLDTASGSYGVLDYDYDGVGNRTQLLWDIDGNQSVDYTEAYNYEATSNRLDTLTTTPGGTSDFQYSDSGQLIDDPRQNATLGYNDADRLTSYSGNGNTGNYTYNALGQRVIKQAVYGTVDHIHYQYGLDGKRLAEMANDGSVLKEYVFFDNLLIWFFTNELSADTDGDLLDDAWEQQHFGDLNQNASSNADGDGLLDLEEFRRGTDPNTPDVIDMDRDGFSVAAGDLNDFDSQVYPGAVEICGDGIDQDNNGSDSPCGDVNADGMITAADALLLNRHLLGLQVLDAGSQARADTYPSQGDGQLTASDLLLVEKQVVGL